MSIIYIIDFATLNQITILRKPMGFFFNKQFKEDFKMDLELIIETVEYNQELADTNLAKNDWSDKITNGINDTDESKEEN
jgi:hypothetical protein